MSITALLPMKRNSSRVPGKNFKPIAGKPLFEWILGSLLDCAFVDQIVINTDAEEELSSSSLMSLDKVTIRSRPTALCGDEVSMNKIIDDDLANTDSQHYLMTHTTNPLITSATLAAAHDKYQTELAKGYDSLFSVNRHQTRFYTPNCEPINHDPNNLIPTQDLEVWYEENSCFYFFSKESFAATQARIGAKPLAYETPKIEACDIDEQEDWDIAHALLRARGNS